MGLRNLKLNTKATKIKQGTPKQGNIPVLPIVKSPSMKSGKSEIRNSTNSFVTVTKHTANKEMTEVKMLSYTYCHCSRLL